MRTSFNYVPFFIIIVFLNALDCSSISSVRFIKRANQYLTHPASSRMYFTAATSSRECAVLCSKETDCRSVNYEKSSTTCELLTVYPFQIGTASNFSTEWTVYHKQGVCDGVLNGFHCYVYHADAKSWELARQYCLALHSNLVYIESDAENTFVNELAKSYSSSRFWIGLTDVEAENVWKWSSGSTSNYSNFSHGEPSNGYGNEHCVSGLFNTHGQWNDIPCSTKIPSMCKLTIGE